MKIFKVLVHSIGLLIAIIFAFRHHYTTPEILFPTTETTIAANPSPSNSTTIKNTQLAIGKKLFKLNCATCHNKNMYDDLTGPALANVSKRWEGRENILVEWIRNSGKVLASGDTYAVRLFKEWKTTMPAFPNLTDEEVAALLNYIEANSK